MLMRSESASDLRKAAATELRWRGYHRHNHTSGCTGRRSQMPMPLHPSRLHQLLQHANCPLPHKQPPPGTEQHLLVNGWSCLEELPDVTTRCQKPHLTEVVFRGYDITMAAPRAVQTKANCRGLLLLHSQTGCCSMPTALCLTYSAPLHHVMSICQ
jgi:hypothetical protein